MTVCKRVLYWGTVQGVGFRVTTRRLAQRFAVTGYVKNLADGQVELVVEGQDDEVERFLAALARKMADFIHGHSIHDETPRSFEGFVISS